MKKVLFCLIWVSTVLATPLLADEHYHAFGFVANNLTYLDLGEKETNLTDLTGLQYRFSTIREDIGFYSTASLLAPLFGLDPASGNEFAYTSRSFIFDSSFGICYSGTIDQAAEQSDSQLTPLVHYLVGGGPNIKHIVLTDNDETIFYNLFMLGVGVTADFALRLSRETRIGFVLDGTFDFLSVRLNPDSTKNTPLALAAGLQFSIYLRTNLF